MQNSLPDRAQAAGIAAAHDTVPANDVGREFHVAIKYSNGDLSGYRGRFVDSVEACIDAQEQMAGRAGKISIRPDVENSYLEGCARYPLPLHPQAGSAAREGWNAKHTGRGAEFVRGVHQREAMRERAYGDQVRGH